jgi:hypothetical protein
MWELSYLFIDLGYKLSYKSISRVMYGIYWPDAEQLGPQSGIYGEFSCLDNLCTHVMNIAALHIEGASLNQRLIHHSHI